MPIATTTHATVHYELDGTGPAIAMVHGIGGDAEKVFGPMKNHYAAERTVIRPNLSGSGATTDDGVDLTVAELAEQVAAAIEHADTGPVDLVGFSLGAVVSAAVAATRPELVRRLVLIGGWAHSTGPRDTFYFETWRVLLNADRELFKRFGTVTGFSPAMLDKFGHEGLAASLADEWPPAGIGRQIDAGLGADIRDLLPKITAETLVIALGLDNMVPPEGSQQLYQSIKGSVFTELPTEGHMDWFAEPAAVFAAVDAFVK